VNVRLLSYSVLGAVLWLSIDQAYAAVPPEPPTQNWIHQFGGSEWEATHGLAVDGLGHVYATGDLGGIAFLRKYHADGTILWSQQFGSVSVIDESFGVSVDNLGGIYVTGHTFGGV
jgi:hypothetical protein